MRVMALRTILSNQTGVALTEFALGLPVILLLGLGGIELSNLVLAHMTASRIASLTADNASRIRDNIDEADVIDLVKAAQQSSGQFDLQHNGRIIISALQGNDAGTGQWIRWQRCFGSLSTKPRYGVENTGKSDASLQGMGPASRRVAADGGTTLMFVELELKSQSIVPQYWSQQAVVRYEAAFNVRKRPNAYLTNTQSLADSATLKC